jgi:acetyl esterase/lipase
MLKLKFNKKTIRGSLARQLVKIGVKLESLDPSAHLNFGRLYSTVLSKNFKYPRNIKATWVEHKTAKMEMIQGLKQNQCNLIIQFHGGAYVSGYNDTYRRSAIKFLSLAKATAVLSLDYRLAPKHPFPAALEDAINAYEYALNSGYDPKHIIFTGDSAGGGLALALGLYLRDHQKPLPKAIITMSAWTDLSSEGESYLRNKSLDPMLGEKIDALDIKGYVGNDDVKNPYISPAYGDYHDFCDLMMHVGSYEVLESDTLTVAKKAGGQGVNVEATIYRGMFHVFQLAFDLIPEAKKAWKEISQFINRQFNQEGVC